MISRVAEHCFWLERYVERVENTARMLQVNANYLLDVDQPDLDRWRPILIVAGEEEAFVRARTSAEADDGEIVQEYLVWDERCSVSIVRSLRAARANAHTIRETISLEAWASLNTFWLWLRGGQGRRLYGRDRHAFYERVKHACHEFHGVYHDTMLHEEPFDFMQLGMLLERAGQTARLLDVKYHKLGPTEKDRETPAEAAQWLAILRSCSATEAFFKRQIEGLTGPAVAEFLLLEPAFPRAVLYCLNRAWHFLQRIRPREGEIGVTSSRRLERLLRRVRAASLEKLLQRGIHRELTNVVNETAGICEAIRTDYFDTTPAAVMTGS